MKRQGTVYLKMKTLQEARRILQERFPGRMPRSSETIPVLESVGRILAEPVSAAISSPFFHAAAMDGIAVAAEDTFGASETNPMELHVGENAIFVNTGNVIPSGCNAVIMIENVQIVDDRRIVIEAPAFPWQYVRKVGEDIVASEMLFPQRHRVTPVCIGAMISAGVFSLSVKRKPKACIIPTGSELVDWRNVPLENLQPGQVLESNSYMLRYLVEADGGQAERYELLEDDPGRIRQAIEEALEGDFDLAMTIGGSSAGSEDHTRAVVESMGEILVHGVTMMPGKPVVVGEVHGKPVFGMPGYPVSGIVAYEQLVRPLLMRMQGRPEPERDRATVYPTRKIPSKLGVEEFLRVKLGRVGDRIVATPLPRGSGNITTFTEAHGIIRIPNAVEGVGEGEPVQAELLQSRAALDNTVVVVGSHDNTLDVLADELRRRAPDLNLSSSHVGSMGGLMALRRGACHMAGTHLLDPEDGSYNRSFIRKHLSGTPVRRIHLVRRDQGLIVRSGNPKSIHGIEDLIREEVRFVNRQGGSGTRILLDYRLQQLGIDPAAIHGYADEEFTHMSVAVAVLSGTADVGLGILAAARALKLDFIPVVTEEYDLVIAEAHFESGPIRSVLETIRSEAFQKRVRALGGYDVTETGKEQPV